MRTPDWMLASLCFRRAHARESVAERQRDLNIFRLYCPQLAMLPVCGTSSKTDKCF